jgi:hypothetical protein
MNGLPNGSINPSNEHHHPDTKPINDVKPAFPGWHGVFDRPGPDSDIRSTLQISDLVMALGDVCMMGAFDVRLHGGTHCQLVTSDGVAMADPAGESKSEALRLDFDRRLTLRFHGSTSGSNATDDDSRGAP